MRERNLALLITIIILLLGVIFGFLTLFIQNTENNFNNSYNKFNFYRAELDINGTNVHETLYFYPDKAYHTLYRTFQSSIATKDDYSIKNSLLISSVDCSAGTAYFRINNYCYNKPDFTTPFSCAQYTENNEYGCTFGNVYGFMRGTEYTISSDFEINPENLFYINGKYYIKFIAYGRDEHVSLEINDNLIINGQATYTFNYKSKEYVIIYIPYDGDISRYTILERDDFEYDSPGKKNSIFTSFLIILAHLIPGILFFVFWNFFGREIIEEDIPEQLSEIPNRMRRPWEVSAFFNPPFGAISKTFFSTMIFDFYRRKIIDIKLKKAVFGNNLMIKINNTALGMDHVEKKFFEILKSMKDYCEDKYKEGEYFNLNKSSSSYSARLSLSSDFIDFRKLISKELKIYIEKKGFGFFVLSMALLFLISVFFSILGLAILAAISFIFSIILELNSALLLKYKEDFYSEYKKWQAFKKWLKGSPSMKETGHKGVILWEEYLVYATALGVSKQVLKELKNEGLIKEKDYNFYTGVNMASISFASSGGSSGGGGFSGGGGGGVGGGGGGGR